MNEKVVFTPNIPIQVALKFPDGKQVEGRFGDQIMYSLMDGRLMYLDTDVAAKINALEVRRAEPFCIAKRWTGRKGDQVQWDVWRPDAAAQVAAPALPPTQAEAGVAAPAPVQTATSSQPPMHTANGKPAGNGNGSAPPPNGNGPNGSDRPYNAAGIPTPIVKVPYEIALQRLVHTVSTVLKAEGEQWSDGARQDLVSTLIIQAMRDGVISWVTLARPNGGAQ